VVVVAAVVVTGDAYIFATLVSFQPVFFFHAPPPVESYSSMRLPDWSSRMKWWKAT